MTFVTACGAERVKKNCSIYDTESVVHDFQVCSSESRVLIEKLFSFYAILCLHGAFRNITRRIRACSHRAVSTSAATARFSPLCVNDAIHFCVY